MSMGSEMGGEDRGNEPPLATVRSLHSGDQEGSNTTAEDWYENERLSGHITSGAPRVITPPDQSASAQEEEPAVLDWRYAYAAPSPTTLRRLARALGRASRRRRALESGSEQPSERPTQPEARNNGRTRAR